MRFLYLPALDWKESYFNETKEQVQLFLQTRNAPQA